MELTMKPNRSSGLLFTFCGLDGCGKTTMIRRLKEALEERGLPVMLTKQPTVLSGNPRFSAPIWIPPNMGNTTTAVCLCWRRAIGCSIPTG